MPAIKILARFLSLDPPCDEAIRYRVCQGENPPEVELPWEKRIVELGDGRSVGEIIQVLYQEQLSRGARLVDIGIWKGLFESSVINTIGDLEDRGIIQTKFSGDQDMGNLIGTLGQRKVTRPNDGNGPVRTAPSRRPEMAANPNCQDNRKVPSNGGTPQRWELGPRVPGPSSPKKQKGLVQSGQAELNGTSLFQCGTSSHWFVPAVVKQFLAKIARRGVRQPTQHRDQNKGLEGG